MRSYTSIARRAGVLFIIGTAAAISGGLLLTPAVEADYLAEAAANQNRVVLGILLELVLVAAAVGMAVVLFPVLKRQDEGLALGYVGARVVEAVFMAAGTICAALLLTLSIDHGPMAEEPLVGEVLLAAREWTYWIGPTAFFSISAIILYTLLYQARLVPRWLSIWGWIGAWLLLISAGLEMFGTSLGWTQAFFSAPIGINEMVLAVWLIVKGFDTTGLGPTAEPGRTRPGRAPEAAPAPLTGPTLSATLPPRILVDASA